MSQPRPATPGWRVVGICFEGEDFDLEGLNPWEHDWEHSQSPRIVVPHPAYPTQRHDVDVWVVRTSDRIVRFAAGEVSASVWAFFLPV